MAVARSSAGHDGMPTGPAFNPLLSPNLGGEKRTQRGFAPLHARWKLRGKRIPVMTRDTKARQGLLWCTLTAIPLSPSLSKRDSREFSWLWESVSVFGRPRFVVAAELRRFQTVRLDVLKGSGDANDLDGGVDMSIMLCLGT